MSRDRHALVIFARVPELGRVKTRLAAGIGDAAALSAYRMLAERVFAAVRGGGAYSTTVAFTPDDGERAMREWIGPDLGLRPQGAGDLGDRMAAAIGGALDAGAERVVVIGTDCPDISAASVEEAFALLGTADVVIGPATDGGYYLIGMSRSHSVLFERVPWSAADTLRVTLERARAHGISVALLEERADIDTADDWRAWLARAVTLRAASRPRSSS